MKCSLCFIRFLYDSTNDGTRRTNKPKRITDMVQENREGCTRIIQKAMTKNNRNEGIWKYDRQTVYAS